MRTNWFPRGRGPRPAESNRPIKQPLPWVGSPPNSPSAAAAFGPGRRGPPKRNEYPGSGNENMHHRCTLGTGMASYQFTPDLKVATLHYVIKTYQQLRISSWFTLAQGLDGIIQLSWLTADFSRDGSQCHSKAAKTRKEATARSSTTHLDVDGGVRPRRSDGARDRRQWALPWSCVAILGKNTTNLVVDGGVDWIG